MRRSSWILLAGCSLLLVAIVAYVLGASVTDQHRNAARAQLNAQVDAAKAVVANRRPMRTAVTGEPAGEALTDEALQQLLQRAETLEKSDATWRELRDTIAKTEGPWTPELRARVEDWFAEHADLVAEIHALAARGASLPKVDLATAHSHLDTVSRMRAMSAVVTIEARMRGLRGDTAGAVTALEDALSLAALTASQHTLLSQLAASGDYHRALNVMHDLLHEHELSAGQLDRLEAGLRDAGGRDMFAAAMANEAQAGLTLFDGMRQSTIGRLLTPFVNMNETAFVESMRDLAAAAERPYHEANHEIANITQTTANLPFPRNFARDFLNITQPALTRAIEAQASHEARIGLAQLAIALERHFVEFGLYPDTLDTVTVAHGASGIADPFTGRRFIYRRMGDGYLLYSIGVNMVDDGGRVERGAGDIVWGGG